MALAKKCDRCGKLYDGYDGSKDKRSTNAIALLDRDEYGKHYTRDCVDLCPECLSELIDWLDSEEEEK